MHLSLRSGTHKKTTPFFSPLRSFTSCSSFWQLFFHHSGNSLYYSPSLCCCIHVHVIFKFYTHNVHSCVPFYVLFRFAHCSVWFTRKHTLVTCGPFKFMILFHYYVFSRLPFRNSPFLVHYYLLLSPLLHCVCIFTYNNRSIELYPVLLTTLSPQHNSEGKLKETGIA